MIQRKEENTSGRRVVEVCIRFDGSTNGRTCAHGRPQFTSGAVLCRHKSTNNGTNSHVRYVDNLLATLSKFRSGKQRREAGQVAKSR
jgi:hypothetical protein